MGPVPVCRQGTWSTEKREREREAALTRVIRDVLCNTVSCIGVVYCRIGIERPHAYALLSPPPLNPIFSAVLVLESRSSTFDSARVAETVSVVAIQHLTQHRPDPGLLTNYTRGPVRVDVCIGGDYTVVARRRSYRPRHREKRNNMLHTSRALHAGELVCKCYPLPAATAAAAR